MTGRLRHRLSVVLLGVGLLGTACSPLISVPAPLRTAWPHPTRDARTSGGTVSIGIWQEPATFLAAGIVDRDTFADAVAAPVAEGLLWYRSSAEESRAAAPADHWRPLLATEVPTPQNGDVATRGCANPAAAMCVTWKLREGVTWHDGSTFSSHDVCDTFRLFYLRYRDGNPTALTSTAGWDRVIQCTELDLTTAVVDFRSRYGPYLTLGSGVYGILPASILDRAFRTNADLQSLVNDVDLRRGSGNPAAFRGGASLDRMIDGTGPFTFAAVEPGKQITLVANRHYWDPARQPHLDRLVFVIEPSLGAAVAAAKSGSVDMAFDLRLANLPQLLDAAAAGTLAVHAVPDAGAEKIDLNLCAGDGPLCDAPGVRRSPYTADPAIRRAMLAGINRPAIVAAVTGGRSVIPPDSWMSAGLPELRDPAVPTTAYDPAAAGRILDQAGYAPSPACDAGHTRALPDGSCIDIELGTTSEDAARITVESMVAADLGAIGIHVAQPFTPNVPSASFFDTPADGGPLYTHGFDAALYTSSVLAPGEPDRYFSLYHGDCQGACPQSNRIPSRAGNGDGQDATGENNRELDRALDAGRASVDAGARIRAYRAAERILAADLPEIPLYQHLTINAVSAAIRGVADSSPVWDADAAGWYCLAGHCQAG